MSPRQQRRRRAMLAAMADLGMTEAQWRQHRANESRHRPRRDEERRRWLAELLRKERRERLAARKGTIVDHLDERTESVLDSLRRQFTEQLFFGDRLGRLSRTR